MDEARRVLDRLARIEQLERESAGSSELLDELRELVREAEEWLKTEREPTEAAAALTRCRTALDAQDRQEVVLLAR